MVKTVHGKNPQFKKVTNKCIDFWKDKYIIEIHPY